MSGKEIIIAGIFILAVLGAGIYCGFVIGERAGRAAVVAKLAPEIASPAPSDGLIIHLDGDIWPDIMNPSQKFTIDGSNPAPRDRVIIQSDGVVWPGLERPTCAVDVIGPWGTCSVPGVSGQEGGKTMSEYEDLAKKLADSRKRLLLVVQEAEAIVKKYTAALDEGREHLRRVESMMKILGK